MISNFNFLYFLWIFSFIFWVYLFFVFHIFKKWIRKWCFKFISLWFYRWYKLVLISDINFTNLFWKVFKLRICYSYFLLGGLRFFDFILISNLRLFFKSSSFHFWFFKSWKLLVLRQFGFSACHSLFEIINCFSFLRL